MHRLLAGCDEWEGQAETLVVMINHLSLERE